MTADCCLPAKRAVLTENFALCYRSNLKCRLPGRNLFSCHVITVLVKTAFFFSINSFHTILFSIPRRFTLMKSKMTMNYAYEVMLISDFNVDEIKSYP